MQSRIDRTATVHPSAHIGAKARVEPGALVGHRASVGEGARVAPDAVVHRKGIVRAYSVLGEEST
ncbi:MAG: UDP-3-O-(3-hydroxymyristoyl)glucosamine N-acyltransferase, partial [Gemmatimonadota bacterium]|nr:UDP-3-O-(3-hydroxymyristoyl)glucosamine N-acyltransferase [Gemmatimonadota bacterium]